MLSFLKVLARIALFHGNDHSFLFFQEMRKVVDMINYEIEYVLRPVSAPIRFVNLKFLMR